MGGGTRVDHPVEGTWRWGEGDGAEGAGETLGRPWHPSGRRLRVVGPGAWWWSEVGRGRPGHQSLLRRSGLDGAWWRTTNPTSGGSWPHVHGASPRIEGRWPLWWRSGRGGAALRTTRRSTRAAPVVAASAAGVAEDLASGSLSSSSLRTRRRR